MSLVITQESPAWIPSFARQSLSFIHFLYGDKDSPNLSYASIDRDWDSPRSFSSRSPCPLVLPSLSFILLINGDKDCPNFYFVKLICIGTSVPRLNPSPSLELVETGSVVSHTKEAEC